MGSGGDTMVEHLTHILKIEGLNHCTGRRREKSERNKFQLNCLLDVAQW